MNYRDLEVDEFYIYFDTILMYIGNDPTNHNKVLFKIILIPDDNVIYKISSYNKNTNTIKMLKNGLMLNSVFKLESK